MGYEVPAAARVELGLYDTSCGFPTWEERVVEHLPPRPRLESRLDAALAHRLTVLVADAGFGKTTLLASWSAGINAVVHPLTAGDRDLTHLWRRLAEALRLHLTDLPGVLPSSTEAVRGPVSAHSDSVRPHAMAELLGHALAQRLTRDLVLVLDDAQLVAAGPAASFVAGLVRHAPPLLHVVLASRGPLPVPVRRLRAQGQLLEVTGAELAFTTGEVAAVLTEVVGPTAASLAPQVRRATGGWPMAVRLAAEALRDVDPVDRAGQVAGLAGLAGPHGQLTELIRATYRQEPAPVQRLLAIGALFERFTVGLCEALGVTNAAGLLTGMARRGLFVEPADKAEVPGTGEWYRLHPLAHRFIGEYGAVSRDEVAALHAAAARWFAEHRVPDAALRSALATGDGELVARLLAEAGEQLVSGGHTEVVLDAIASVPAARRDARTEQLAGHAYLLRGEWDEALARYHRAAGEDGPLPAGLAWRIGMIYYLRGEHDRALATFQRAGIGEGAAATRDTAMVVAWAAAVHWIRGDSKNCGELAAQALGMATEVDDPAALATAHTVLSMLAALEGDRRANAAHYGKALAYAQQAGDVLQLIRIHTNRCSHNLEEGAYGKGLAELDDAIRLADLYGYGAFGGVALTNRGQIRLRLGQLEEAHRDLETALAIFDEHGSRKAAYPLTWLGDLYHLRGDPAAAAGAYERALQYSEQSGDRQVEVPALAGLARLFADSDPHRASSLAEQAVACGEGIGYVDALLAAARVALARDDREAARQWGQTAASVAAARRDRAGVAEAEELAAAAADDDTEARALAGRSAARWAEIGDPIGQARAELVLADRLDPAAARGVAEGVRQRMRTVGCRLLVARADALLNRLAAPAADPVRVETLGTFRVVRDGEALPASAWRSRKARDVLKILLARRGRPVTRDYLMETLWPGEPPEPLANRLNVAISTLRSVLNAELVVTEDDAVRIRLDRVDVDVDLFLADAKAGMALLRTGRLAEALSLLARAEGRYGGDFLEEDLYQDWAVPLREQARAAYLEVAAVLAEHASKAGDTDSATRYLLRMLEHDPYDERAHLRLVSTFVAGGRHGDARRHYRHYCSRMDEIDVEAAPFPA
jgi:ATP/maltotriose-dependent transcriptional regulator MalT/DNA-binding SARP family transcriptional activator